jgi:acyl-CoA dehydrogenase
MDFSLTEEQHFWQMKARKFAIEEIRPISLKCDQVADPAGTFDWEIIKKGSRLGFRTAVVPTQYGGHGIDFVTQALVMIELARGDGAIAKTFSQCWKWGHLLASICTDEQKERFLKPFIADEAYLLGRGITEVTAGSDNRLPPPDDPKAGLKLRAERQGDEWILNGEKIFIANGNVGKLFFVDARANPNVSVLKGVTMFLVPRDTVGLRVGRVFNKSGWRFYQNTELIFDNARVPHANMVGEVDGGDRNINSVGDPFSDLEYSAIALGVCDAACEQATGLVKSRMQAGQLLIEQQLVQLNINRMCALTEALRFFVLRVAWEYDRGIPSGHGGLLMNYASEVAQQVAEFNQEIHAMGGNAMDPQAEKLVRDSFIWTHIAGDAVQRMKVAQRLMR